MIKRLFLLETGQLFFFMLNSVNCYDISACLNCTAPLPYPPSFIQIDKYWFVSGKDSSPTPPPLLFFQINIVEQNPVDIVDLLYDWHASMFTLSNWNIP